MNYSKILSGFFLGMFFVLNAQNNNSQKKLIASAERPGVITKKTGANMVGFKNPPKAQRNIIERENQHIAKEEYLDAYTYPPMRAQQGAVLPFEVVFDDSMISAKGIEAQGKYHKRITAKPERNTIIYQDVQTTRERLNAAGIFDAQDFTNFDMPLIARIVGAGVLVTAKVTVNSKKVETSYQSFGPSTKAYRTKIVFKIYDKKGETVFTKTEAPHVATTADSYFTTLCHIMKQTPYYHK